MAARQTRRGNPDRTMSLGQHLLELRKRLFRAALGVLLASVVGFLLSDWVWDLLREPITRIAEAQNRNATLNYTDITSAFDLKMQLSIYLGIFLSSPIWLYQTFAYIVPALTGKEKRYVFGFFFAAVPLFLAGCAAGWWVLPNIVQVLTSFGAEQDAAFIESKNYLHFVVKLMLAIGIGFVMPVVLVLLNMLGIMTGKSIIKGWRFAILAIVLFAGIATPAADVMSMFLLAAPMFLLYFLAAGIALLNDKRVARRIARLDTELTG